MISLLLPVIYLAFISLGLPDSLLGAAWPSIYQQMDIPFSYAGLISMLISVVTIISSLLSDRLTKLVGVGKVTAFSVLITAIALFGFSKSNSFYQLILWSIPYGFGAGSIDAALNNYVAIHYKSRHMSWLHCMWGVGTTVGPYVMGLALSNGENWTSGYRYIAIIQIVITIVLFVSFPLWKKRENEQEQDELNNINDDKHEQTSIQNNKKTLSIKEIVKITGVKEVMITFFCYCALESTTGLWASSYLVLVKGISLERAASFASLFYIGITLGRAISGFLTFKFNDTNMIRIGISVIFLGIVILLLPFSEYITLIGFITIGLGCAPIYPSIIHSTPIHFGRDRSQSIIGVQMASAYIGTSLIPPFFGFLAGKISCVILPFFILVLLIFLFLMHENLVKKTK